MNLSPFMRAYIPAIVISLILVVVLKTTGLSPGIRVGIVSFAFMLIQGVLWAKATGAGRTRDAWVTTLVFAALYGMLTWFVVSS